MKIIAINQYFPPDRAATARLLGQLATELHKNHDVTVICGTPTYAPEGEAHDCVRTVRVPLFRKSRERLLFRIVNYVLFFVGALFLALKERKSDVVMCWTDPPLTGLIGAAVRYVKGSKFIFVSQDVYPEAALAAGKFSGFLSLAVLRIAGRLILRSADHIIAIGRDMENLLAQKGALRSRIVRIENWQDLNALNRRPSAEFRSRAGIRNETFLIMHSGNVGYSQDFETLLGAARLLQNKPEILFLIVGDGGRLSALRAFCHRWNLETVRFLPYQNQECLAESLGSADLHYVSLRTAFVGAIVPSKIYGIMAVGKPIVANVPPSSDTYSILEEANCAVFIPPDSAKLADTIRKLSADSKRLATMGQNGRLWSERNDGMARAMKAYNDLFRSLEVA